MKKPVTNPVWADKAAMSSQMGELEGKYEADVTKAQKEMTAQTDKKKELETSENLKIPGNLLKVAFKTP